MSREPGAGQPLGPDERAWPGSAFCASTGLDARRGGCADTYRSPSTRTQVGPCHKSAKSYGHGARTAYNSRRSKPAQSATVTGAGNGQHTRKSVKNQIGDPRFLDQVNKGVVQRRAILGLDAPLQMADVTPPPPEETTEQRRARLDEIFRLVRVAYEKDNPQQRLLPPNS
jgi:hypothetical protein